MSGITSPPKGANTTRAVGQLDHNFRAQFDALALQVKANQMRLNRNTIEREPMQNQPLRKTISSPKPSKSMATKAT